LPFYGRAPGRRQKLFDLKFEIRNLKFERAVGGRLKAEGRSQKAEGRRQWADVMNFMGSQKTIPPGSARSFDCRCHLQLTTDY
jgi:hypothetical protein